MEKAIDYDALKYLKSLIGSKAKITNVEVRGKWLRATLESGTFFSVKNNLT